MAILSYFRKYFTYLIPEFKSYRIESTYANGNLLYSKGNFVGDIYTESGDKIYSDGDYYGDHYVSCIALDDYGHTILNSGRITIYSSAYQDAGEAVFDEITQSDGTKKRVLYADKDKTEVIDPVFYADEKGNLVLTGTIYANAGKIGGLILDEGAIYSDPTVVSPNSVKPMIGSDLDDQAEDTEETSKFKVTAEGYLYSKAGTIGGFTIADKYLANVKTSYEDSNSGVYLGTDGIGLGKINSPEIIEPDNIGEAYSGFFVTADGTLWSQNGTFSNATIEGTGTFNSIETGAINCVDTDNNPGTINVDEITVRSLTFANSGAAFQSTLKEGGKKTMTATVDCTNGSGYSFTCTVTLTDGDKKAYVTEYDRTFSITFVSNNGKRLGYGSVTVPKGKSTSGDVDFTSTKIFGAGYQFPSNWYFSNSTTKSKSMTYNLDSTSIEVGGSLVPLESEVYDLGSATSCWGTFYVQNLEGSTVDAEDVYTEALEVKGLAYIDDGVWNASDVEPIPDVYSSFFDKLYPVRYKRTDGTSGRYHTGLIAQDVSKAIEESGLSTDDFVAYVMDKDLGLCGLRYDEFIALLIKEVQDLKKEIKVLKNEILL